MAIKVNGATSKLMKRGAYIQSQIKELQGELAEVKIKISGAGTIDTESSGAFVGSNGSILTLTERKQYEDMDPSEVLAELKKNRDGKHFPDVVKVMATPCKKFFDDAQMSRLRKPKASSISWSFK